MCEIGCNRNEATITTVTKYFNEMAPILIAAKASFKLCWLKFHIHNNCNWIFPGGFLKRKQ